MIQGHIKNLLYTYDCVIIPEFGGLITHYAPAKIHPVKHTFSPPSKRVAFNEQLKVNDGLLISTLAKHQQWPLNQAQQAVSEFVQNLKEQLLVQHRFELQDVGVFRYNAERKLVFENIESENFLEASFGLPELVSKPIIGKESLVLRGKYKDQTASQAKENVKPVGKFKRLFRIGASLVVGGLTLSAAYVFSLQNDSALSSLNPFNVASTHQEQTTVVPTVSETVLENDVEEATAMYADGKWGDESTLTAENKEPIDSVWGSFEKNTPETPTAALVTPAIKVEEGKSFEVAEAPRTEEIKEVKPFIAATPKAEKKEAGENHAIKKRTGRFYVIMGVFTQDGYAKRNQSYLKKQGYAAKIVQPPYDLQRERVSVADFATVEEAYAALPELRTKINNELWVFNY